MDEDDEVLEEFEDIEVIYSDGEEDEEDDLDEVVQEDVMNEVQVEVIDLAALTFEKHQKAVFCSDLSPDGQLAVTGSEDDMAYLWNTSTGEVVLECTGHKDSVSDVCFSSDGQYVATGDMSGMIQVWHSVELKLIWCFEGDDMEWLLWHSMANVLFCGCHSGDIYIWQIPQGNCKVLPAIGVSPASCAKLLPNGKQLLAGYEDGQLRLWNIKEMSVVWSNSHDQAITSIDLNKEGTVAILALSAELVRLSDGKIMSTLLVEGEKEIETGVFNSALGLVVTGSLSGHLCVWESSKQVLRHEAKIEAAVTTMKWGTGEKIFIGATDGAVYVCDVKNYGLVETLTGHKADILSISVFKDGTKILTTSDDGTAKVFHLKSK